MSRKSVKFPFTADLDNIMVRHQHDVMAVVFSRNLINPAVVGKGYLFCFFVNERKKFLHGIPKLFTFGIIVLIFDRYGFTLNHLGKPLGIGVDFFVRKGERGSGKLSCLGRDNNRSDYKKENESENHNKNP